VYGAKDRGTQERPMGHVTLLWGKEKDRKECLATRQEDTTAEVVCPKKARTGGGGGESR